MKHKRQTLSKTDDEDNKDSLKSDDDSQACSEYLVLDPMVQNAHVHSTWDINMLFAYRFKLEEIMPRMWITIGRYTRFNIQFAWTQ